MSATCAPIAAEVFTEADRVMAGDIERPLSSFMHPGELADDDAKKHAFKELTRTEITQPAVLTMDAAVLAILRSLGYRADMVVGHSLGEYGACIAAGVMPFEGALKTVAARGAAMANVRPMNDDNGWMLAVSASAERVEAELEGLDGYIVCANKNCHAQTVTGGETETSKRALEKLTAAGLDAQRIPVSHAFHTKIIAPATEALLVQQVALGAQRARISHWGVGLAEPGQEAAPVFHHRRIGKEPHRQFRFAALELYQHCPVAQRRSRQDPAQAEWVLVLFELKARDIFGHGFAQGCKIFGDQRALFGRSSRSRRRGRSPGVRQRPGRR